MNEIIKGELIVYCESIITETKPIAILPVQERFIEEAERYIGEKGLQSYSELLSDGWYSLYIYKESFMEEIIKELPKCLSSVYEHWILGKAFGYSDSAIKQFLCTML